MQCFLSKASGDIFDITEYISPFRNSGAAKECARKLALDIIQPHVDAYMDGPEVDLGDTLLIQDENKKVFKGVVWEDEPTDELVRHVTCYDLAVYLNKCDTKTQVFTKKTPQEVTQELCKELGLKTKDLAQGPEVNVNGRNMKAYDIIMLAYTNASKETKKKYKLVALGDEISVIESGKNHPVVLEELDGLVPGKILDIQPGRRSMDDLVNQVEVIEEGKQDKKEEKKDDKKSQEQYGLIKSLLRGSRKDLDGAMEKAKKEVSIEVVADWGMVTGMSVEVKHKRVSGAFYIIEDEHEYKDGLHTAKLKLSTEFEMDSREEGQTEAGNKAEGATEEGGKLLSIAQSKKGKHYSWGAAGPNAFDCSGFVSWCAIEAGLMPPGSRLTSGNMDPKYVHKVSWDDIRPGDIVHFRGNPGHVAYYIGNDQVIECGGLTKSSKYLGYSGVGVTSLGGRRHGFKNVYRFNKLG